MTPDVLIPRPETELLVEAALALLPARRRPVIVDVGTGSGCIALSLAAEMPGRRRPRRRTSRPTALWRSPAETPSGSGSRSGSLPRTATCSSPWRRCTRHIDLVVSNPPYVDRRERETLAPEVRDHEPELALFPPGGADSIYRRLVPAAYEWLRPGGFLVVEIPPALAEAVSGLLAEAGFGEARVASDLAGRPRMARGRKPLRTPAGLGWTRGNGAAAARDAPRLVRTATAATCPGGAPATPTGSGSPR